MQVLSIGLGILFGCWSESPLKNGVIVGLVSGLIGGMFYMMFGGVQVSGASMLIAGLIGGLGVGSLNNISVAEVINWNWKQFWKEGIRRGVSVGVFFGLVIGLSALSKGLTDPLSKGLSAALGMGLLAGSIAGLFSGLGALTTTIGARKIVSPNEGVKLSGENAAIGFTIGFLTGGLFFGLFFGLIGGMRLGLIGGLGLGLAFGLILGLNRGGSAVVKHYAVRSVLCLKGYTPIRFIGLLDYSAKLILLTKVGGGYIFIHRMLLEYFADLKSKTSDGGN